MKISTALRRFQLQKIRNDLVVIFWVATIFVMSLILILLSAESVFWLPPKFRSGIWLVGLVFFFLTILSVGVLIIQIKRRKIVRYTRESCAIEIGVSAFLKDDDVLNAVQLERSLQDNNNASLALINQFLTQIKSKLSTLSPKVVLSNPIGKELRQTFIIIFTFVCIISLSFLPEFMESGKHWIHPQITFTPPHPFRIKNLTGNIYIMGGDSTSLAFKVEGRTPDSLILEFNNLDELTFLRLRADDQGYFRHNTGKIFQNIKYRALSRPNHFWQRWGEISSVTHSIEVIDRPTIEKFSVTVNPPSYSKMKKFVQEGNVAEIRGLVGSLLEVDLSSDMNLSRAYLSTFNYEDDNSQINLEIQDSRATGIFRVNEELFFTSHIFDKRNIGNLDPIEYKVLPIPDAFPNIEVLIPPKTIELGSDFSIPVQLHIQDDFGFSNLQIVYETKHPSYVGSRNRVSIRAIPNISFENTSQDVFYVWDLSGLELMPEDEVKFHFELYDNDQISGPKKSLSPEFVARFPSIADLFTKTNKDEDLLEQDIGNILQDFDKINNSIEEMELKLLKSEELEWEDRQSLQQSVSDMKSKLEELESIQETINDIMGQAEKHNLFSNDLMKKFRSLNKLLQDIITPEIMESIARFQDSMDDVKTNELIKALKDLHKNAGTIGLQLDRFIDIFRRIRAEQKIDELAVRISNLVEHQETLANDILVPVDIEKNQRLLSQQEHNTKEFQRLKDLMIETSEAMSHYARMPSDELDMLSDSPIVEVVSNEMHNSEKALRRNNLSEASKPATSAVQALKVLEKEVVKISDEFRSESSGVMAERFEKILFNTLFISKEQEQLRVDTRELPRNSPRLAQMASRQQMLRDQLNQLITSLMQLSKETFAITPEMGKAIGRSTLGMNESLKKLEERSGSESVRQQDKTVEALNEAAVAILVAMEQIRQTGSASGFEEFLERMRQITASQEEINTQTFQLAIGQMAAVSQQQLIRELKEHQAGLKKSLDELMREMRGSNQKGDHLGNITKEMEEVIRDFENNIVNRRTVDRQQRILTRMLDAQKSLRQQDMNEKRRAIKAGNFDREGPGGLPLDLGQRRNLAIEALNNALKAGYPHDYQAMMRKYFNSMSESNKLLEKEIDEVR